MKRLPGKDQQIANLRKMLQVHENDLEIALRIELLLREAEVRARELRNPSIAARERAFDQVLHWLTDVRMSSHLLVAQYRGSIAELEEGEGS